MVPEVATRLRSALKKGADLGQQTTFVWVHNSWIGERAVGPQVFIGFVDRAKSDQDCLYEFEGSVVAIPLDTVTELQGKKLVVECVSGTTADRMVPVIRAIDDDSIEK